MDVLVGQAAALRVDFESPTGMLIPDANSVTYQVFGTDGTSLVAATAVVTQPTDTGISLSIAGSNQTITAPRRFEKRTVLVSWTTGGQGHSTKVMYRVVPFLNLSATPDQVRGVIGVNDDELTDDEIDLVSAYFLVETDVGKAMAQPGQDPATVGPPALAAALATGTRVETLANQAVIGQAVLELFSGMPQQIGQTIREGVMVFQRFQQVDWDGVVRQARDMRARGMAAITGKAETNETLLLTICSPDPVTHWCGKVSWP